MKAQGLFRCLAGLLIAGCVGAGEATAAPAQRECRLIVDVLHSGGEMLHLPPLRETAIDNEFQLDADILLKNAGSAQKRALIRRAQSRPGGIFKCGDTFADNGIVDVLPGKLPDGGLSMPEKYVVFSNVTFSANGKMAFLTYLYHGGMLAAGRLAVIATQGKDGHWTVTDSIRFGPVA